MQHGRVLGNGSIGVQWKSSYIQRPFKEQYILQGEPRGKPKSFLFFETGSHYVSQAGLRLLGFSDPLVDVFNRGGVQPPE